MADYIWSQKGNKADEKLNFWHGVLKNAILYLFLILQIHSGLWVEEISCWDLILENCQLSLFVDIWGKTEKIVGRPYQVGR